MARTAPLLLLLLLAAGTAELPAHDRPQWGEAWSRNQVSNEIGLPSSFNPTNRAQIKWEAELGSETHSTPVIAGGRVYIGTNNERPRDPRIDGDRGVLLCLDEQTGKLLWQLVVPKRTEDIFNDWPKSGICSPPTIENDRVYLVSNRGEAMCLDANGMINGNDGPYRLEGAHMDPNLVWLASSNSPLSQADQKTCAGAAIKLGQTDADIVWLFEMTTGAGIWSHDAAHSSVLIDGDYLYLNTGTGVDNTHKAIRAPDAPSLIVLDKKTGQLIARENEHMAPNIFHNTWSAPSMGTVNGRKMVFFAGGNGIVYAFEPLKPGLKPTIPPVSLHKIWQCDFDPGAPKTNVHKYNSNRKESPSNVFGMPVLYHDRLYVAGGGDIWWGKNQAWLKCIAPSGEGDITTNGLVWSYELQKHVMSTPAAVDGMIFIADVGGLLHCVDATSGKPYWTHPLKGEIWASPFVADGKVYIGTRSGEFAIFSAAREKKLLSLVDLGTPISSTAVAANGVLYVTTMNRIYALRAAEPTNRAQTPQ